MKLRDGGLIILIVSVVLIAGGIVIKAVLKDDRLGQELIKDGIELETEK